MYNKLALVVVTGSLITGCASVPMESIEESKNVKKFNLPSGENAGVYIYRASGPGTALKKDILIDGKCIGETAPNMFFHEVVRGGEEHKISTESEFSPNIIILKTESGKNYFVQQYIKIGVFVGGASLEVVSEEKGKKDIEKLELAKKGKCGK